MGKMLRINGTKWNAWMVYCGIDTIKRYNQVKSLEKIIDDIEAANQLISDYFNATISCEELLDLQ